jgi:Flp pilus assembly protein TadD
MWEAREHGPVIQAAERAAEAGNYTSAEKLLREAARLQEASLGPRHPDLANTLNNLGIVCEMTSKPDDAEQYFRRAVSIARTSLAADHPFVATSQKNLRDFCEARGKAVEPPAPAPEAQPQAPEVAPEVQAPPPVEELRRQS